MTSSSHQNLRISETQSTINVKAGNIIVYKKNEKSRFSVGYLTQYLMKTGLFYDEAYSDAMSIAKELIDLNISEIKVKELLEYAEDWYKEKNIEIARRLQILSNDMSDLKPFVILLGGVTGIGKSTIARMLAERLEVKSLIGTDLIRESLRSVFSPNLMPTLHTSSYTTSSQVRKPTNIQISRTILGFEEQAKIVITGAEAAALKTLRQNEIMIIEGVHLVPGMLNRKLFQNPSILQILLVLDDKESHLSRLKRREKTQARGTHYSKYFEKIRTIQSYLIEKAQSYGIKVIDITNDERTLVDIINHMWKSLT